MLSTATPADASTRLEQIARLNDRARLGFDRTARTVITRNCLERLAEADGAPKEQFLGHKVWLKVDYYDAAMEFGSEDPADASQTTRVITILLPEDY